MQGQKSVNILGIIALILVLAGFGAFYVWDKKEEEKEISVFQQQNKEDNQKQYARSKAIAQYLQNVQESVENDIKGFAILGDDFAAARNNTSLMSYFRMSVENHLFYDLNLETYSAASLEKYQLSIPMENHAVVSESYHTILTRYGINPLKIDKAFTMPAKAERVDITLKTNDNVPVAFAAQEEEKLGKVIIDGIAGRIYFQQNTKGGYTYQFVRSKEGSTKQIKTGAKVQVESADFSKELVPVIFFGNNDFRSVEPYIQLQKKLVDRQTGSGKRYIVVARTDEGSELDKAMKKQFGEHYLRVKVTERSEMDNEQIAEQIYETMDKMGYFDKIKSTVSATQAKITAYDQ